jgi:hypothetical protein
LCATKSALIQEGFDILATAPFLAESSHLLNEFTPDILIIGAELRVNFVILKKYPIQKC